MSPATNLGTGAELIVVRYGELWLKGKNRPFFERRLARNVKRALASIASVRVERGHAQMIVFPRRRIGDVARRLQDVFGIASLSPAWGAEPEKDAISQVARRVLQNALESYPRAASRRRGRTPRNRRRYRPGRCGLP